MVNIKSYVTKLGMCYIHVKTNVKHLVTVLLLVYDGVL